MDDSDENDYAVNGLRLIQDSLCHAHFAIVKGLLVDREK